MAKTKVAHSGNTCSFALDATGITRLPDDTLNAVYTQMRDIATVLIGDQCMYMLSALVDGIGLVVFFSSEHIDGYTEDSARIAFAQTVKFIRDELGDHAKDKQQDRR